MIKEYPSEIIGEDFKLVKLAPTKENLQIIFDIIVENREEFGPWLEWVDFVQKPEDEKCVLESDQNPEKAEWFIQFNNKIVGRVGFALLQEADNVQGSAAASPAGAACRRQRSPRDGQSC